MSAPDPSPVLRSLDALWPEVREHLTQRQAQLLWLHVRGLSALEIAQTMGISLKTVEAHLRGIRAALGFPARRSLSALLLKSLVDRLSQNQEPQSSER